MADLTVLIDAMLTERHRVCLLCRSPAKWMEPRVLGTQVWLGVLCQRCHQSKGWAAIDQVLRQRYGLEAS